MRRWHPRAEFLELRIVRRVLATNAGSDGAARARAPVSVVPGLAILPQVGGDGPLARAEGR